MSKDPIQSSANVCGCNVQTEICGIPFVPHWKFPKQCYNELPNKLCCAHLESCHSPVRVVADGGPSLSADQVAVLNRVIKHMADGAAWCPDGSPLQGELLADAATLRALITPTNPADTERKE